MEKPPGPGGPMRVLHVIPSMAPEWGGPAVAVAGLAGALQKLGVHSEIATTTDRAGGPLLATPHLTRHSFRRGLAARVWAGYSRPLAAHLERAIAGFDIVHIHGIWHFGGLVASRIAKRHDVPYIVSTRGELDGRRLRHKPLKKLLYRALLLDGVLRRADALHAVAAAERDHVARLGLRVPVFVCQNGVDLADFDRFRARADAAFLAQHRELQRRQVVLYMGRIESLKGLDVLAQAFVKVASRRDGVALLVAGGDEDGTLPAVRRTLRQGGVAERAAVVGFLTGSRKSAALACADVFVLSSYSEGFSNAVVEALAAGVPVVISEQCNFPEVASAGAGLVVPAEPDAVAEAIGAILADPDLARRMGRNARRLIEDRYQWSAIAGRMAQRYREVRDAHVANPGLAGHDSAP